MLKQFTPPILVPMGRAILRAFSPKPAKDVREIRQVLKTQFEKRNANVGKDEIALRDGLRLKTHPESRIGFEYFCHWAPEMVKEMDVFIELTKNKRTLLDIGALHGIFSLVFAAKSSSKKAVAVDASPIAFARLLYNIHKNRLHNVTAVECALSDDSGILSMHYEWEHAVAAGSSQSKDKQIEVAKRTGDDLCKELSLEPDVIKIDVEGHEVKVVKGLSEVLWKHRPLLFLELHPARILEEKEQVEDLINILFGNGYLAAVAGGKSVSAAEISSFTNDERLVFTPTERA